MHSGRSRLFPQLISALLLAALIGAVLERLTGVRDADLHKVRQQRQDHHL